MSFHVCSVHGIHLLFIYLSFPLHTLQIDRRVTCSIYILLELQNITSTRPNRFSLICIVWIFLIFSIYCIPGWYGMVSIRFTLQHNIHNYLLVKHVIHDNTWICKLWMIGVMRVYCAITFSHFNLKFLLKNKNWVYLRNFLWLFRG